MKELNFQELLNVIPSLYCGFIIERRWMLAQDGEFEYLFRNDSFSFVTTSSAQYAHLISYCQKMGFTQIDIETFGIRII